MCSQVIVCALFLLSVTDGSDPPGHLQPLGSHTTPHPVEVLSEFPHPVDFYENFMKQGKPVLFKSVLEKNNFKPFKEWNDKYLREKFGRYMVEVEEGKVEDRTGELKEMMFQDFLEDYTKDDIYMVQDLPPKMMEDVILPYSLRCGGPQNLIYKAILWFSSGGTKSVLHMDAFDNVNCLIDGTKDLVLFDKKYGEDIEKDGYVWEGSYSSVDANGVDMYKFPFLRDMPWYKAQMEKGDCLFIPSRWYHQVNSYGSRNLAINVWLYHPYWFNSTDCSYGDDWKKDVSINSYGFAKMEESLRYLMLEPLEGEWSLSDQYGDVGLSEDDFLYLWEIISINIEESSKLFHYIDTNKDGFLTWDELYRFPVEEVYAKFPKAFGNDFREQYREKKDFMKMLEERASSEEVLNIPKDEL